MEIFSCFVIWIYNILIRLEIFLKVALIIFFVVVGLLVFGGLGLFGVDLVFLFGKFGDWYIIVVGVFFIVSMLLVLVVSRGTL